MLGITKSIIRQFYTTLSACFMVMSCGSYFGWSAPTFMKLTSPESEIRLTSSEASWVIALIEVGYLCSPIPAGLLADKFGRKLIALASAPISIASWLIMLYFKCLLALSVGRILQGIVLGIVLTVVPMYLGEISIHNIRGTIISFSHVCFYFGLVYEYVIGPFVSYNKLIIYSMCLPMAFIALFSSQPESPHFYMMHENEKNAMRSLIWLRGARKEDDVKDELLKITQTVREDMKNKVSFVDIIATPADRKALLIVQVVSLTKLMSGIAPIMAYSTDIYQRTRFTLIPPYLMTIITGLVMFISAFFSTTLTDFAGRRPLLIISTVGCALCLAFVSALFYLHDETSYVPSEFTWAIPLCIVLYTVFFAFGLDPVSITYRVEMFPTHTRSAAAGLSNVGIVIGAFTTLKLFPFIEETFGAYAIFLLFSMCSFLGSTWIYFYAIETKNKSSAEIRKELSK